MYDLLKEFIKPEFLVLVPVLYLIGMAAVSYTHLLTQAAAISIFIWSNQNVDTGQRQSGRLRKQDAVLAPTVCVWWKLL